jgi:hypothetical protein
VFSLLKTNMVEFDPRFDIPQKSLLFLEVDSDEPPLVQQLPSPCSMTLREIGDGLFVGGV